MTKDGGKGNPRNGMEGEGAVREQVGSHKSGRRLKGQRDPGMCSLGLAKSWSCPSEDLSSQLQVPQRHPREHGPRPWWQGSSPRQLRAAVPALELGSFDLE